MIDMAWEIESWEREDGWHARCTGEGVSSHAGPKDSREAAEKAALKKAQHEKRKDLDETPESA
jgi:hypothetical protein